MSEKEGKSSIQVLERTIRLLDALAAHPDAQGLKQLAAATGLHPSTAHRILAAMVEGRLVERVEPGSYRLGMRLLELGHKVKSRINVRREALPYMQRLNEELGEAVNLSVRQGDEVVYVERTVGARSAMRVVHVVGARAPLHITAVGKIYLAQDGSEKVRGYAERSGLPAYTEHTLRTLPDLMRAVDEAQRLGYAFDNEEAEKGVACIGAGIYDDDGRLVAGLSVSAPVDRLKPEWTARVKATAEEISRAIGYDPALAPPSTSR